MLTAAVQARKHGVNGVPKLSDIVGLPPKFSTGFGFCVTLLQVAAVADVDRKTLLP